MVRRAILRNVTGLSFSMPLCEIWTGIKTAGRIPHPKLAISDGVSQLLLAGVAYVFDFADIQVSVLLVTHFRLFVRLALLLL
jgi:hypothetical protein